MAVVGVGTPKSQVPFPTGMAAAYAMKAPPIALTPVMGEVKRLGTAIQRARMVGL